ncbi:hypothetical protein AAC387_Pa02g5027 [Persea americana]
MLSANFWVQIQTQSQLKPRNANPIMVIFWVSKALKLKFEHGSSCSPYTKAKGELPNLGMVADQVSPSLPRFAPPQLCSDPMCDRHASGLFSHHHQSLVPTMVGRPS